MKTAYLVIAHGSREKEANQAFLEFLERFRHLFPKRFVIGAFLELARPSIAQAIDQCVEAGMMEIIVMPLMFFSGRHVKKDIPQMIEEAKAKHPAVDFHFSGPLCESPMMMELLDQQAAAALGGKRKSNG